MKPAPFALLAFAVIASTFGKPPAPDMTFVSPCEGIAFHGINRWVTKKAEIVGTSETIQKAVKLRP